MTEDEKIIRDIEKFEDPVIKPEEDSGHYE